MNESCPRNHLNLLNGRVALVERPVFFPSKTEDSSEIAVKVDFQLSLLIRPQFDALVVTRASAIARASSSGSGPRSIVINGAARDEAEQTARTGTWQDTTELVNKLNRTLRGWANYWGFAHFEDGKPADEAVHNTCFSR